MDTSNATAHSGLVQHKYFQMASGYNSGTFHMAMDEFLLEQVRKISPSESVVYLFRTYLWEDPTLSFGAFQPKKDIQACIQEFSQSASEVNSSIACVRRPTGGRSILHGEDISYAIVTNDPALIRLSLKQAYQQLTQIPEQALQATGVAVYQETACSNTDYTRSPLCFETRLPSDLINQQGQKLVGSAQLRRQGGILQHGAIFTPQLQNRYPTFHRALIDAAMQLIPDKPLTGPIPEFTLSISEKRLFQEYLARYHSDSLYSDWQSTSGNPVSTPTTVGSHLTPASC